MKQMAMAEFLEIFCDVFQWLCALCFNCASIIFVSLLVLVTAILFLGLFIFILQFI